MPLNLGQRLAAAALAQGPATNALKAALLVVKGSYLFETQGGHGTFALTSGTPIPAGAVAIGGYIHVTETVTGGAGATIALNLEGAADLAVASVLALWTAGEILTVLPAPTSGSATDPDTSVVTTTSRDITATVAVNDLTDGAFDVVLFVIIP